MYGNYGAYGYNPFSYGIPQPAQQRLNDLQQQQMYQQQTYPQNIPQGPQSVQMLKGRIVGSVEEAKAAQVDLDGSVTYFASPGEGKIYTKSIGLNGLPVFQVYELGKDDTVAQKPQNNDLVQRLETLEKKVKELSEHESNAIISNVNAAG